MTDDFLALVCAGQGDRSNYCEVFDGAKSEKTAKMKYPHWEGSMAFYDGRPTAVGGWKFPSSLKKVETLDEEWKELTDHPR